MTSRRRLLLYLAVLHVVFAACAVGFLLQHRIWLLAAELYFAVSAVVAVRLVRSIFAPLDMVRSGAEQLRDSDFTTRFRTTGQSDMDGLVAVYNAMADRLRDERVRQEEQNAFLERVLAASPAGIVVLDFDGCIATLNPAARRLLGDAARGAALGGAGTLGLQLAGIPDGESRVLTVTGARRLKCTRAQFIDRGFPRSFFVFEELTEELRRSEKAAYEKLIRMMSHEVNNTTGAVGSLLSASVAYGTQLEPGDRADFGAALDVSIARMRALSDFMKRFADVVRLPAPQRSRADVAELVQHVAAVLNEEARRRGIVWRWDLHRDVPQVALDRPQMEQALLNILKNALEAIGDSGTVTVRLTSAGSQIILAVQDTGPGVPDDVREHLFAPFHTTKDNGQGIGLTLTREILLAHGFEFALDNAAGGGAEFLIRMPM